MKGKHTATSTRPPGSHPHSDLPNWRPAETVAEYIGNCEAGLEDYSERRMAKLYGVARVELYRWRLMGELPDELLERLLAAGVRSSKGLAAVAHALKRGNIAEVERCPHCGGTLRIRGISDKVVEVVNQWIAEREP